MITYVTLSDVQARIPQFVLNTTSKPTAETTDRFLANVRAEIESALTNWGYDLTQTDEHYGPRGSSYIQEIACDGTIARILYARAASVGGDSTLKNADAYQKRFETALLNLGPNADLPLELIDWPRDGDMVPKPGPGPYGLDCDPPRATLDKVF